MFSLQERKHGGRGRGLHRDKVRWPLQSRWWTSHEYGDRRLHEGHEDHGDHHDYVDDHGDLSGSKNRGDHGEDAIDDDGENRDKVTFSFLQVQPH